MTQQILDELRTRRDTVPTEGNEYYDEIQELWAEWVNRIEARQSDDLVPMSMSRVLGGLREVFARDGIVLSGAGHPQDTTNPEFPVYAPRLNLSARGFSTMDFSIPAAMGAKLGQPDRQVVTICGDGSFLHTNQELVAATQEDIDITVLVLNNHAWLSIRNLQVTQSGWD